MSELNLFFPTPVWASKIDDYSTLNLKLLSYINKLKANDREGVLRSNINGWHSKDFNLSEDVPKFFIQSISNKLQTAIQNMNWDLNKQTVKITNMWAIVNTGGASNSKHHHGNSDLSAAYYIKAPKDCGEIVFYDPRPAPVFAHPRSLSPNNLNCMVNSINPVEGGLILFPSYLEHSVNKNNSEKERIVISFNISIILNS